MHTSLVFMMNTLNFLFHRSTLPLSNSLSLSHRCYSTDSCSFTRITYSFSQYPNANLVTAFLGRLPKFVFRQLSVTIPSKQTSSKTSVSSTLSLLAYLASKPTCDVASFSDYSRLETAKRDRCCPEKLRDLQRCLEASLTRTSHTSHEHTRSRQETTRDTHAHSQDDLQKKRPQSNHSTQNQE